MGRDITDCTGPLWDRRLWWWSLTIIAAVTLTTDDILEAGVRRADLAEESHIAVGDFMAESRTAADFVQVALTQAEAVMAGEATADDLAIIDLQNTRT